MIIHKTIYCIRIIAKEQWLIEADSTLAVQEDFHINKLILIIRRLTIELTFEAKDQLKYIVPLANKRHIYYFTSLKMFKIILLITLLALSSAYYIETYDKIHNITVQNGQAYQLYYQPGYCLSDGDVWNFNEKFNISVIPNHACEPRARLDLVIPCPFTKSCISTDYLNCTNKVSGVNETKVFTALVNMISTVDATHNAVANYTIRLTWKNINLEDNQEERTE